MAIIVVLFPRVKPHLSIVSHARPEMMAVCVPTKGLRDRQAIVDIQSCSERSSRLWYAQLSRYPPIPGHPSCVPKMHRVGSRATSFNTSSDSSLDVISRITPCCHNRVLKPKDHAAPRH